ncbi:hypothetical protein RHSP_02537 [Rhizobium freirei PRF 81]|uniref:Uncharacterized protein n=1 Tax=Rhizobium freirei PRF 81 TaxID=363754 RepID=N6VD84_9HYPH|nr:hypothetical protein RHSP_02537 [Rhizobium freirei PRF 81]
MAVGHVRGDDAVDLEGDDDGLFMFGAEGADDRLQRAHPAQRAGLHRCLAPAHGLRPWEVSYDVGHDRSNDFLRGTARLGNDRNVEIALLRVTLDLRLGDGGEAGASQEAFDRLLVGIGARTLALFAHIGRACGQAANIEREAPRRPIFPGPLIGKTRFDQGIGHQLLQVAGSLALHTGRNFLGAKFEKEIGHVKVPHPPLEREGRHGVPEWGENGRPLLAKFAAAAQWQISYSERPRLHP